MPRKEVKSEELETCTICLNALRNKSHLNSCDHTFCFQCIVRWAKKQTKCPVCRGQFTEVTSKNRNIRRFPKEPQIQKPRFYVGAPIFAVVVPMVDFIPPTVWPISVWPSSGWPQPSMTFNQLPVLGSLATQWS